MNTIKTWWATLATREQRWVAMAAAIVSITLLWLIAIAPALQILRKASAQHAAADVQLEAMRAQAKLATALREQRALGYEESLRNLENSVKQTLGSAGTLSVNDTRASVTLKGANADALATWLSQARINARAVPTEARLQRSNGASTQTSTVSAAWDGTMVLSLPPR
jgi:general secretion pathway protein M